MINGEYEKAVEIAGQQLITFEEDRVLAIWNLNLGTALME